MFSSQKKLTWLQKGLRPLSIRMVLAPSHKEEIDLITEGITTWKYFHQRVDTPWRNWPDYRRDYDAVSLTAAIKSLRKKLTWLQKGLRPLVPPWVGPLVPPKKLTWLQKGLRQFLGLYQVIYFLRRNWPDYRRDYDACFTASSFSILARRNWPDYRRDYDCRSCAV